MVPEWIRLSGDPNSPLVFDIDDQATAFLQDHRPDMPVLPLLQNYKNEQWNSDILTRSIDSEDGRRKLVGSILDMIDKNKFAGLTIDIEEVPPSAQRDLFTFMSELHEQFQSRKLILAQ